MSTPAERLIDWAAEHHRSALVECIALPNTEAQARECIHLVIKDTVPLDIYHAITATGAKPTLILFRAACDWAS